MSGIWWERGEARIKKYSAVTTGKKTVVKVEIEVSNHHALGYLLGSIEREEADQGPASPARPARKSRVERIANDADLLMIPHFKGGER